MKSKFIIGAAVVASVGIGLVFSINRDQGVDSQIAPISAEIQGASDSSSESTVIAPDPSPKSLSQVAAQTDVLKPNAAKSTAGENAPQSDSGSSHYVEVFKGLETKSWYYKNDDPAVKDRIQKMVRDKNLTPLDSRLTLLLDFKQGELFSLKASDALTELQKIYRESDIQEVTYIKGLRSSIKDLSQYPLDAPVCTVKFNKDTTKKFVATRPLMTIGGSEIVELGDNWKGVRVYTQELDASAFWIRYLECYVYQSDPSSEVFKRLAIIHLVATLGIDGDK
ncbi:MAG: hypothetical protein U1E10_01510 [Bdellovibrionales bacterium]|nr:hypothetical protein [Bdellovibrionales bacterium]